jgi:hypothetical protein
MVLELVQVHRVDGLTPTHEGPPFTDPFFQHLHASCVRRQGLCRAI